MDTLNYILKKYNLSYDDNTAMPIRIPGVIRDDLGFLFDELGFTKGAEIGVESGLYSSILLASNPNLVLYSIDAWKSYRAYRDHTSQEKLDRFYENTKQALKGFGDRSIIWKKASMDAVKEIPDESLDFVYIDANHAFAHVAQDVHYWLRKVRKGGIISGHDYKKHKAGVNIHVKQVINGYTDAYYIRPWFVLGADAKIEGIPRDASRSFMWVKI
jgi:predicted O-methyltransferase YrrM